MATYASGYSNGYQVRIEHNLISQNWGGNYSVVRSDMYVDMSNNWFQARVNGDHYNNGNLVWAASGETRNYYSSGSYLVSSHDVVVYHDGNGNASASTSCYMQTVGQGSSWSMPYRTTSGTLGLPRIPQFPSAPTSLSFSRSVRNVTVSTGGASGNGGAILEYQIERTTANQTAWAGDYIGNGGTYFNLTPGASYRFRSRARTDRGWGNWADIGGSVVIPTAPAAPASVTPGQSSGLDIPVTVAASPSTGGEPISSYSLQWSNNAGSSWSTAVTVTAGTPYTFTNLQPGLNYLFRAYSTNAIGDSATTTSSPYFLTAGGKRWDGTAWQVGTISRRWDGTQWVNITTAKRWNGTDWVVLT